jgi:hypothetical protein
LDTTPDAIAALKKYLAEQPGIAALTENGRRIFPESLPPGESPNMPRGSVVLKSSGGGGEPHADIFTQHVDVRTYGANSEEATKLQILCMLALQNLDYFVAEDTILYCAKVLSTGNYGREAGSSTGWKYLYSVWSVLTDLNSPD